MATLVNFTSQNFPHQKRKDKLNCKIMAPVKSIFDFVLLVSIGFIIAVNSEGGGLEREKKDVCHCKKRSFRKTVDQAEHVFRVKINNDPDLPDGVSRGEKKPFKFWKKTKLQRVFRGCAPYNGFTNKFITNFRIATYRDEKKECGVAVPDFVRGKSYLVSGVREIIDRNGASVFLVTQCDVYSLWKDVPHHQQQYLRSEHPVCNRD